VHLLVVLPSNHAAISIAISLLQRVVRITDVVSIPVVRLRAAMSAQTIAAAINHAIAAAKADGAIEPGLAVVEIVLNESPNGLLIRQAC
jgi:hypothetical protein